MVLLSSAVVIFFKVSMAQETVEGGGRILGEEMAFYVA